MSSYPQFVASLCIIPFYDKGVIKIPVNGDYNNIIQLLSPQEKRRYALLLFNKL